jgi:hypothetical protein
MSGPRVFVSASFPSGEPGEPFKPYDTAAIADATTAVVRAVLRAGGRIVFGAHPTISPLVLLVAGEQGAKQAVDVYQSYFFEAQIPEETTRLIELGFAVPHWTERVPGETEKDPGPSLALMRDEMLKADEPIDAAVFIGGMAGIFAEEKILREERGDVPRLPLKAPGGAARGLERSDDPIAERLAGVLESPFYPELARRLVAELRS